MERSERRTNSITRRGRLLAVLLAGGERVDGLQVGRGVQHQRGVERV